MLGRRYTTALFTTLFMVVESWNDTSSPKCRTVYNYRGYFCPVEDFAFFTCLSCYLFLPDHVIPATRKFRICPGHEMRRNCTHVSLCAPQLINDTTIYYQLEPEAYNLSDPNSEIYQTFVTDRDKYLWELCCHSAVECCHSMTSKPASTETSVCPRTWDGWQCFDDTAVNQTYQAECPEYSYLRSERPSCSVKFTRECQPPGHWPYYPLYPNLSLEWTDYSACMATDIVAWRHYAHLGAYGFSLLALAPAILIFFLYKQLRVQKRITMHINLFISIFLNGVVFIIFKYLMILSPLISRQSIVSEGTVGCKFLYVLTKYFRTSNYMWMFCEGFYLHKLIVAAFAEQKNLLVYYLIGWGFPVIPVIVYSCLMLADEGHDSGCWYASQEEWLFHAPNLVSLALNVVFLCNIIRVIVIKLRATNIYEPSQYKKAVRATFVLVPLFGVHFLVTIYKPTVGPCEWLEAYFYINYLLDGLQGFLVALIFCYLNGEVHVLIKRSYKRWIQHGDPNLTRHSMSTQVISMTNMRALSKQDANLQSNGSLKTNA